jgi:cation:H+ antiporter
VTVAGIALVVVGAELLVSGAVAVARSVGVPEAVIGLTVVAVGTSLPELATAIVAAVRKQADVVLGNVIGSNIFNVLGILGTTALITPIEVGGRFRDFDVPLMGGISGCFLALLAVARRIGRASGAIMVGSYIAYTAVLYMRG